VAAAAYRAGVELRDERTALVHDYERRTGVESAALILPDGQASSAERSPLWNAAEAAEKRKDARTAREWVVAIPAELVPSKSMSKAEAKLYGNPAEDLVREFAGELARRYGVAVDVAIHRPGREGDERNWHAHLLATTRQATRDENGRLVLGDKASIELSDAKRKAQGLGRGADEVTAVRALWADLANRALEREGHKQRIDHRSLEAQGIERPATVHLGPIATEMERRGVSSDRGDHNREVAKVIDLNAERARLQAEREHEQARQKQCDEQLKAEPAVRRAQGQQLEQKWTKLVHDELKTIQARAAKLEKRSTAIYSRTSDRLEKHNSAEPAKPGAVASVLLVARARWVVAWQAWDRVREAILKRLDQLKQRIQLVREYMREPVAGYSTKGTQLAAAKVAKREPELPLQVAEFRTWRMEQDRTERRKAAEQRLDRGPRGPGRGRGGPDFER
jgi:hypothetical protein